MEARGRVRALQMGPHEKRATEQYRKNYTAQS